MTLVRVDDPPKSSRDAAPSEPTTRASDHEEPPPSYAASTLGVPTASSPSLSATPDSSVAGLDDLPSEVSSLELSDDSARAADLDAEDEKIIDDALEFSHRQHDSSAGVQEALAKPIAISQVGRGVGMPFARAWAPALSGHDILPNEFLGFIDNLNVVASPSPPLQAAQLASMAVGMIPFHWAMIASLGASVAVGAATSAQSKIRASRFLKRANREFFGPRGLKVEICNSDNLKEHLGMPLLANLVLPLEHMTPEEQFSMAPTERRMRALQQYTSPLELQGLPAPSQQSNAIARFSQKQVQKNIVKREKRLLKSRNKTLARAEGRDSKHDGKHARKEARRDAKHARKEERRDAKHARKEARHARRHGYPDAPEASTSKADYELARLDSDEHKAYADAGRDRHKAQSEPDAEKRTEKLDKVDRELAKELHKIEEERAKLLDHASSTSLSAHSTREPDGPPGYGESERLAEQQRRREMLAQRPTRVRKDREARASERVSWLLITVVPLEEREVLFEHASS